MVPRRSNANMAARCARAGQITTAYAWVYILAFTLLFSGAAADDRSLRFLFDSSPYLAYAQQRRVHVYDGSLWKSKSLGITFHSPAKGATAYGESTMEVLSKGRRHVLAHHVHGTAQNPFGASTLSLSPDAANPLWISWRFAAWNNVSLMLSSTPSPRIRSDVVVPLSPSGVPVTATDATTGEWIGEYTLIFNPDAPLSLVPPHLFFLLTDGSAAAGASAASRKAALRIECISLRLPLRASLPQVPQVPQAVQLCDGDMPYFGMGESASAIVIGGGFWRANYSAGQIDGHTAMLTLQIASLPDGTADPETLEWVGAVVGGIVGLFMLYSRWATGPGTLSVGTLYAHAFEADAQHWRYWLVDMRFILGSMLLAVFAVAANAIGWIAFGYATIPLTGVYFEMLIIAFSAYGSFQALVAGILTLLDYNGSLMPADVPYELRYTSPPLDDASLLAPWLKPRYTPVGWAWVRQLLHVTAILALSALAIIPLAFKGGVFGSTILLLLLLPPVLVGLFHHTYFVVAGIGVACGDRRGFLGFRHPGVMVLLAFELLLLLGYAAVVVIFLFQPVVDSTSAFFSSGPNYLLAIMLAALAMMGALFIGLREVTAVLHREANKRKLA